jgi:uncharacterized protein with NAD-binding domain and iron-sulfur cluster
VSEGRPVRVAVIGGGCASIAAAFELSRPENCGKYEVTVYQVGWRLGGKGASGRGAADRIEEHGLHLWMGFYENAFMLLRECYAELGRDPRKCRFADWRDALVPEPFIGVTGSSGGGSFSKWMAFFPPGDGFPGDPLTNQNPFTMSSYLTRSAVLLQTLLMALQNRPAGSRSSEAEGSGQVEAGSQDPLIRFDTIVKYGLLATAVGLREAAALLEVILRQVSAYPVGVVLSSIETISMNVRRQFESAIRDDQEMRRIWEIVDLLLAFQTGVIRFGLLTDARGFDAINDFDTREWLRINGASESSVNCALMRGLYDLALAYEGGDFSRPRMAAGLGLRGCLRMFFTYRGAMLWKMQSGMGDVVFAPFYEVLKRRGVAFKFFHRLTNVKLADASELAAGERPYVKALEFDLQARVHGDDEYQPLIDVRELPCWPAQADYSQLVEGEQAKVEGWQFESFWDRRSVGTRTLKVTADFDFVVLGVGIGEIPYVCRDIIAQDRRWREMVAQVKTVATQAFQVWMQEDMETLGWHDPPTTLSGFAQPFDTWADMRQLIDEESWPRSSGPRAIAYFCSALPDPADSDRGIEYVKRRREEVRLNAVRFLNRDISKLWPGAGTPAGKFRWELLVAPPNGPAPSPCADESRFDTQFWTANINPSDRYTLSLPGSIKYRISPLDNTYDNLTIAGDWTSCGLNQGCVEAAVISGRLAAHAISSQPALSDIVGYDHP